MNNKNTFLKIAQFILKFGLGFFVVQSLLPFILLLFFVGYLFRHSFFPSKPNKAESIEIAAVVADFHVPKSFELVYSRNMGAFAANICLVFSYPGEDYRISNTQYNYPNQNPDRDKKFLHEFNLRVSEGEGCKKYFMKFKNEEPTLFIEYDVHYENGRGAKVFVNQEKNLIMFEGYIYD